MESTENTSRLRFLPGVSFREPVSLHCRTHEFQAKMLKTKRDAVIQRKRVTLALSELGFRDQEIDNVLDTVFAIALLGEIEFDQGPSTLF